MIVTVIITLMKTVKTVKTGLNKKVVEVTLAARKITMCLKRETLMKVMMTIMKVFTLDCQVHIKIHIIIILKENFIICTYM